MPTSDNRGVTPGSQNHKQLLTGSTLCVAGGGLSIAASGLADDHRLVEVLLIIVAVALIAAGAATMARRTPVTTIPVGADANRLDQDRLDQLEPLRAAEADDARR